MCSRNGNTTVMCGVLGLFYSFFILLLTRRLVVRSLAVIKLSTEGM